MKSQSSLVSSFDQIHHILRTAVDHTCLTINRLSPAQLARHQAHRAHPLFHTYYRMIQRCHNPEAPDFHRYGGRGIQVCRKWYADIEAFISDVGARPSGHSLDRIDNMRGYAPDNCRWSTYAEQCQNRRSTRLTQGIVDIIRVEAKTTEQKVLAKRYGVAPSTIHRVITGQSWAIKPPEPT